MSLTPIKKIVSTAKGVFDAADTYAPLDIVMDESGSKAYMAIADVPAGSELTDPTLWAILIDLSGVAAPSRINAASVGIPNDGTECSAAVQNLLNVHPTLYFPPGAYNFKGIVLPDNTDIIFEDAIIDVAAADDFIFDTAEASMISIKGGRFRRMNNSETLLATDDTPAKAHTNGIFRFENCNGIKIQMATFADSMTMNNVRCISCKNVEIAQCVTEAYHGGNFLFQNDCENVHVHNCIIRNGTNLGYSYIYPVASSFGDYSNEYTGIRNFTVENCTIEYCDWEGLDSHGGTNIIFRNNRIINTRRMITAYADERPVITEGVRWGDILIENNYCYRDPSIEFKSPLDSSLLMHGATLGADRKIHGLTLRGNTFINPVGASYGLVNARYCDLLVIDANDFVFEEPPLAQGGGAYNQMFRFYWNHNARFTNNRVIGHTAHNSVITVDNSSLVANDNTCITAPEYGTLGFIQGVDDTLFYYRLNGNKGNYDDLTRTHASRVYAPGEWTSSAGNGGLTGRMTFVTEKGLRKLQAKASIEATATFKSNRIEYADALIAVIPGLYVEVTVGGDTVAAVVEDVGVGYFTLDTLMPSGGDCTVAFPTHSAIQMCTPTTSTT